jgi:hypothetical protein
MKIMCYDSPFSLMLFKCDVIGFVITIIFKLFGSRYTPSAEKDEE